MDVGAISRDGGYLDGGGSKLREEIISSGCKPSGLQPLLNPVRVEED